MIAIGAPVSVSFRVNRWMERGRPLARLAVLEPYHLTPVVPKRPPR